MGATVIDFRPTRLRLEPMAERCLPSHSPVSPNFAPAGREFADTRREDRAPVAPLEITAPAAMSPHRGSPTLARSSCRTRGTALTSLRPPQN